MSFGWGVGDILTISQLAITVYSAYKDAPKDYKNIAEEVKSLQIIINKAAQHFKSPTLSDSDRQEGKEVLKGCQSVLEDLNSLIKDYNSVASGKTGQVFKRVMLGMEDVATLRVRLVSNTGLLSSFIRSCEFLEMQSQLNNILGLHRTGSRVSIDSITSFAGSTNTKTAFKKFCQNLYQIGVRADTIRVKESEILDIFKPQNMAVHGGSSIADQDQLPAGNKNWSMFDWVRPPVDFLVGPSMLAAATAGDTKQFISALKYIRNVNFEDDRKETALHKAANKGHKDIVQLLLEKGALVEAINKSHNTPLHLAAQNGHTSTVELLLGNGASIDARNEYKNTPIHQAALNGHTRTVKLLLKRGALIEATNRSNSTPLHVASGYDVAGTVELLLRKGASIEATDWYGNTPLHLAAWVGHIGVVELLLMKGASIEATDKDNDTPLHLAAQSGHTGIVELLLINNASIEATDKDSDTPLRLAIRYGHTMVVDLLLGKGASTEAKDKYNNTPLHLAARNGHADIVELLLENGASIEAKNTCDYAPLHLAAEKGHADIMELLRTGGAKYRAHE